LASELPRYRRAARPSKLDPFRKGIHRLLREDGALPWQVIRERRRELSYDAARAEWSAA
jgi:hypothetical protein